MTYLILFYILTLGLIIGSFLNALLYRLHEGETIMGRSYCPKCKKQIAWYDNIPVFSFIFLRGKCRKCHEKISWQYPAVEFITGILFLYAFWNIFEFRILNFDIAYFLSTFNFHLLTLARDLFFISIMIIIFIYDLKWYLILDRVTLPAIAIIFGINLFLGLSWTNLLIGAFIGGGFFLAQFIVSRGRWIGGGDIRLGLLMGVMFSWPMILLAILLAYLIGSVISIFLVVFGMKKWGSEVPLGIFLTTASIITLFWGNQILSWYIALL
ncbi:MAG: prepilin peptidase [Patescibacteria group bacterium]|jgi:prepilin signal peptidase PulO-like enzyme (type II secretory pathway)|nr:prepilin peptidase [Patescibacteria group bacterium]